jgi:hypothetical protein
MEVNVLITLDQVKGQTSEFLILKDPFVIEIVLGFVTANQFDADPVNLYLIGPPSSAKTELIQAVSGSNRVRLLSSLTPQTLISGFEKRKNGVNTSLLLETSSKGQNVLAFKDFTTILEMRNEYRSEILAQVREISDGNFVKSFGNGQTVSWKGKMGFLFGVTPVIDNHYAVHSQLGERFLNYRLDAGDDLDGEAAARKALEIGGSGGRLRGELTRLTAGFINQFTNLNLNAIELDESMKFKLSALAELIAKGRTGVAKERTSRAIIDVPEPERTPRLVKQLRTLGCGVAAIHGKNALDTMIFKILKKVAFDSIPKMRKRVLGLMAEANYFGPRWATTRELIKHVNVPESTLRLHLEDLAVLGMLNCNRDNGASSWQLSERCRELLDRIRD